MLCAFAHPVYLGRSGLGALMAGMFLGGLGGFLGAGASILLLDISAVSYSILAEFFVAVAVPTNLVLVFLLRRTHPKP